MRRPALVPMATVTLFLISGLPAVLANSAPTVSNVHASQRQDASRLVDITYDLADADGDACAVWVMVSDNGGASWHVPAWTFSGHVGANVAPGAGKRIIWDAGHDVPGKAGSLRVRVWADDAQGPPMVLVPAGWFPYQKSSPIYLAAFLIDKDEVTNAFYSEFLNNADPNGDHWYSGMSILRSGSAGSFIYTPLAGKESHPVVYVNYYDAVAFAQWRSSREGRNYRLPTEQEWEKAAAWDPVEQRHYNYGYHSDSIDCSWCNYWPGPGCVGTTTPVGYYDGTGGRNNAKSYYGCYDMAGNVWGWTGSLHSGESRVLRGGSFAGNPTNCSTTYRDERYPPYRNHDVGFRLALDPQ